MLLPPHQTNHPFAPRAHGSRTASINTGSIQLQNHWEYELGLGAARPYLSPASDLSFVAGTGMLARCSAS
jgi:hypothetical protein